MAQEISHARVAQHVDVDPFDFAGLRIRPEQRMSRQARLAGINEGVLTVPPDHATILTHTRPDHLAHAKSPRFETLAPRLGPALVNMAGATLSRKRSGKEHDGSRRA